MAQFGSKIQYSLLAAAHLAARYDPERFVKAGEIARRTGAPQKYLGQILLGLKARALVRSEPGRRGGYQLMRRPALISVAEVMEAVASADDRRRRRRVNGGPYAAALQWLATQMESTRRRLLSSITLADLVGRASPEG